MKVPAAILCLALLLSVQTCASAGDGDLSELVGKQVAFGLPLEVAEELARLPDSGFPRHPGNPQTTCRGTLLRLEGKFIVVRSVTNRVVYILVDRLFFISEYQKGDIRNSEGDAEAK
jgi:hypothetical protein